MNEKSKSSGQCKPTISLEAYIKMQNDWLIHWEDYDNGSRIDFEVSVRAAQSTINELLKLNNVSVEGME